jgi:mono/diheme cytochrome c family protein
MQVKPSDLTVEAVRAQSDGELFWKITTGRKPMPDFAGKLDDDQRWQTVLYVRALSEAAAAEAAATEAKATPTP